MLATPLDGAKWAIADAEIGLLSHFGKRVADGLRKVALSNCYHKDCPSFETPLPRPAGSC